MNIKESVNIVQLIWAAVFISIGALGRYILVGFGLQPFPNFEIIMVVTFLGCMLLKPAVAFLIPLLSMVFSDLLLGNSIFVGSQMNRIVLFTYSGFALIALVNVFNRDRFKNRLNQLRLKNIGFAAGCGIGFVLLYDVWTNIGWWYIMYPHNVQSLVMVLSAGIPFMVYHLISGVITFVVIALPILVYVSKKKTVEIPLTIKNIQKIPVVLLTISLIVLSFSGTATQIPQKSEFWLDQSDETSIRIVLIGDGWVFEDNIIADNGETVFSALEKVTSKNKMSFEYTYYEQFDSFLIDLIYTNRNGDNGRYWQFYVNNQDMPPVVGADKYHITNGDVVEWRFELFLY
ncbi:MAG: DUF4430 domain-containing protein [Thermoplasmatota archaeon]